jgi:pimeloyl-ACP methyl ester carboxylesterase
MGNSFGCMVAMHILMNKPEIEYKASHLIAPFFGFHPAKKANFARLLNVAKATCYMKPSAALPATIHNAGQFEKDGAYLPRMEYQVPWLLDINNPARLSGVPFRSFITFCEGCYSHEQMVASGGDAYKNLIPIQFTYGDQDDTVCIETIKGAYEALSDPKNLICIEGGDHNPFWEREHWESITASSDEWFQK